MYTERQKTLWYVEVSGDTNEITMEYLSKTCDATPDKIERHKDCSGVPHNLLNVERAVINTLEKNKRKFKLLYTIYKKQQGSTCVRIWEFEGKKKLRRTKKFKDAEERLKKIQAGREK